MPQLRIARRYRIGGIEVDVADKLVFEIAQDIRLRARGVLACLVAELI